MARATTGAVLEEVVIGAGEWTNGALSLGGAAATASAETGGDGTPLEGAQA